MRAGAVPPTPGARRHRLRQALAAVLGTAAALGLATAALLVLCAGLVADPDRPGRVLQLALAQPTLRAELAQAVGERVVEVWAERHPALPAPPLPPVVAALEGAMADPELRAAAGRITVRGDQVDYSPLTAGIADRLDEGADRADAGAGAVPASELRRVAADLRADPGLGDGGRDLASALGYLRGVLLVLGGMAGVVSGIAMTLAVLAAYHRRTAAALVVAGATGLLGLLLDPPGGLARARGWAGETAASGAAVGETLGRWPMVLVVVAFGLALVAFVADVGARLHRSSSPVR